MAESAEERKARAQEALKIRMALYKSECQEAGGEIMKFGSRLRLSAGKLMKLNGFARFFDNFSLTKIE